MDVDAWREQLEEERQAKDEALASDPHSPIPQADREGFQGLAYHPPDPRYRLVLPLEESPKATLAIPRTSGDEVVYEKLGRLTLALPDGTGQVTLFQQVHGDHTHLFLPLKDATSGKTTYGAGRYLDPRPLEDGRYLVDLNRLYHPFCAYNEAYACPMTPPENHLDVPIHVGERLPGGHL